MGRKPTIKKKKKKKNFFYSYKSKKTLVSIVAPLTAAADSIGGKLFSNFYKHNLNNNKEILDQDNIDTANESMASQLDKK